MADINSNILINIDTTQAMSALRGLDKQISALNRSMIVGTKAASLAQADFSRSLLHNINSTGMFTASMGKMSTATEQFSRSLETGKLSLREYYRYGMASTKTFGKNYAREFSTVSNLVEKRVKTLQSQYIQLGKDASGALNSMRVTPKNLNYSDQLTQMSMTIQRQQILNKLLDDGSTKLLNFGKNTQWAGRQLMVGFTIPLAMFAGSAIKSFKEIETQAIRFKKVYGDIFTTQGDTDKALKNMRDIAKEYTKYGLKVADTIGMAADAAAAGNSGKQLEEVVKQASKLAVLGGVAQDKALETTIALQNAFSIGSAELGKTMDFLNSVENQTVLSLEDLSNAIPRVAPIIKQLGGNVEDLAFFLTAMKEGGISAEQGANALKSGLASLINPSKAASEAAAKLGINLKGIIEDNQGNLKNTVVSFAQALQPLSDLQRSQTIEKVFGKYQFSRISALLNNITQEGTQASRVLRLASASAEELALLSQREMKAQESSPMYKMQAAIEKLKASIAPIGELFAKTLTPVIEFFVKLFDKFNNAPEGIKKAVAIIVAAVAGIGPVLLMTVGLVANGIANLMKMFNLIRKGFQNLAYGSKDAALGTQYLTNEELENVAVSNSLATSHRALSAAYALEHTSLVSLTNAYREAKVAMSSFASTNPGMFMPSVSRITPPRKFATGGIVPGTGNKDTSPALLTPGEAVIPADMTKKYAPFISKMIDGSLPGHMAGRMPLFLGMPKSIKAVTDQRKARMTMEEIAKATEASRFGKMDPTDFGVQLEATTGRSFPVRGVGGLYQKPDGTKVFVKPMLDETAALAEVRATTIAREAHGLNAPEQTIRTMIDPTDPLKKRKLIALEAPYNPEFAKPTGKFSKDEYFRQLVASGLRGDKDLQIANLSGNNLVDVGPAGVFSAASGLRSYAKTMPSVEDQVRINLLGVKGSNTRRFFAEETTNIPKGMTPQAYNQAMVDEIDLVLPKLRKTIKGFGDLNPEEQGIYQNMIKRLEDSRGANWRELHGVHSSVIKSTKKPLTPAAIKKIEDEITLRARQKGHASSLSDKDFMEGFAKWAQGNGFAKGGIVPGFMAGRVGGFGAAAKVSAGVKMPTTGLASGAAPFAIKNVAGNMAEVAIGGQSIKLKAADIAKFESRWKEFEAAYPDKTIYAQKVKDLEARILEYKLKNKSLDIGTASGKGLFANVNPWSSSRTRSTPKEVNSRWSKVLSDTSKNKPAQKLLNYYAEELASVKKNLVDTGKITEAEALAVLKAPDFKTAINKVRSGYGGTAASHIKATGKNRDLEFWPANNVVRDQPVMNSGMQAISKKMGGIHVTTEKEAQRALDILSMKRSKFKGWGATSKSDTWTTTDIITEHLLRKRLRDGYYKNQKFKDSDYMPANTLALSKGIFSVPGPKGAGDIQPAMLSPGEAVIPAKQSAKYRPLIQSMISGTIPEHGTGRGGKGGVPKPLPGYTMVDKGDGWGPSPVATRSPDKVEKAIDKMFSTPKMKKLGERIEKLGVKFEKATPKVDKLEKAVSGTTNAFGKDDTRGFRGWLNGYGNVSNTVTDSNGVTRTATPEERTNMRQSNRMNSSQKMMGVGMAAMMVPMLAQGIASAAPDSAAGQFASKNMMAIMGASMIPMIQPLLNSPLKLVMSSALALALVFKMQAGTIKKNIVEGQKQAETMTMTTNQLEALGKITGTMSITQVAQAKRAGRNTDLVPVSVEFGNNILESSDFGKNLKSSFETTMAQMGKSAAVDSLVNQLGTAVSQGVLGNEQAESIAIALTRNLKDARLELDVRGRLIQLLGPDGKNLIDNPLSVQLELISSGQRLQATALDNLNRVAGKEVGINRGEGVQLGLGAVGGGLLAARAGIQAANMAQGAGNVLTGAKGAASLLSQEAAIAKAGGAGKIGTAIKVARAARVAGTIGSAATGATGVGIPAALVGTLVSTVIFGGIETALRSFQKGKEKAAIGKAAGIMQGLVAQNLSASQGSVDALTSQYDAAIANLELKKKTLKTEKERAAIDTEIATLNSKKDSGLKTLRQKQADILGSASSSYDQVAKRSLGETLSPFGSGRGQVRDKYMEAFKVGMQEKFKDNAPLAAQASALQSQLDTIGNDKVTLEISTLVTSDVLTPSEASTLVSTLTKTGGDISKNLKAMVDVQGTEGLQRLSTILTMLPEEANQKQLLVGIQQMNKTDADATMSAIEELGKIPDFVGVELGIETNTSDIPRLKAVGKELAALKKQFPDGKITLKALVKMQEEAGGKGKNLTLDSAITHWNAISKLPKDLQFQAMFTIGSLTASDSFDKMIDRELQAAFLKKNPKYAGTQMFASEESRRAFQRQQNLDAEAFKSDPKNIAAAEKTAIDKLTPKLFGAATPGVDPSKAAADEAAATLKSATSFLDDLGMKLKLFRDQAFDALNPLKSIMSAFSNTKDAENGLGRMFEKFNGLQQIMLKGNMAPALMDAISGMSAEEFKAFQGMDLNPNTKEKETPFIKDAKGNITGLSKELMALSEAFNSVTVGMAQMGAAQSLDNIKKQQDAFKILRDAGMSVTDALKVIQDQALTSAIAAGTLGASGSAEMKKFIKDIADANNAMEKMQVITDTLTKNAEFDIFAKTPEVAKAMKAMGYSAEQIDGVLGNPAMLKQFTQNIKDGKIDIAAIEGSTGAISEYLKDIESKKLIDIQINFNKGDYAQVASSGLDMVNQMFAVQEDLITTGVDSRTTKDVANLAANESKIKALQEELRPFEAQIEQIQYKINDIQAEVSLNISQKVDKYQKEISELNHEIDVRFNEPIQKLQDQSNVLSNDLNIISNAAEEINKRYEEQAESLSTVKEVNDAILAQQQKQISLSDALTSGDISAAGKAMQDMRKASADLYANAAQKSLDLAKKNEIEALVATQGLTQEQIKQKQYEISQKIYSLDTDPKKILLQEQIKSKTASIYELEEARKIALEQIQTYENQIAKITKDSVIDRERMITALTNENEIIQARIDKLIEETTVLGKTKEAWAAIEAKVKAYDLSKKDLDTAFAALLASSTAINAQWTEIMGKIGAYAATPAKDSKIMTTAQTIVTNSGSSLSVSESEAAAKAAADKILADAKANAEKIAADAKAASEKSKAEAEALVAAALKAAADAAAATDAATKAAAEKAAAEAQAASDAATKAAQEAADTAMAAAEAAAKLAEEYAAEAKRLQDERLALQIAINKKLEEEAAAAIARTEAIQKTWAEEAARLAQQEADAKAAAELKAKQDAEAQAAADAADLAGAGNGTNTGSSGSTTVSTKTVVVKPGDTLSKIAKKNGISLDELIEANPKFTENPKYDGGNKIWSGTTVKIPQNGSAVQYNAMGGLIIPKMFASGGYAKGTDTVPAMLTPGEFVMSKYAVATHGAAKMKAINSGASVGDSVYNYSVSVNVKSDANPDEIARAVMTQIKQIDGQKLRGSRF
jgi:LysM repeat protein